MTNLIGYFASLLLAISLLVNNDLKFRWVNTLSCVAFLVYGILLHAFPLIVTNFILILINSFYLFKIYRTEEEFDLVEFDVDNGIIKKFIAYHHTDLHQYFPKYDIAPTGNDICFVVLRDMVIANLFVANLNDKGFAYVQLNYTVPKYRDHKVGKYIFNKEKKFLQSKGVNAFVYKEVTNKHHLNFLKIMGFVNEPLEGATVLVKHL